MPNSFLQSAKFPINCDMGEGFGVYSFGADEACMPLVTHANIACGFHASDPSIMLRTIQMAKQHGVGVGAHPGLPDREGFGRRPFPLTGEQASAMTLYQVGALAGLLRQENVALTHIKPHGALHHMAITDEAIAEGLAQAIAIFDVPAIVIVGSAFESACIRRGIEVHGEFCADLECSDDGAAIMPDKHASVDPDWCAQRVIRAVEHSTCLSVNGKVAPVRADSITVHSDFANSVEIIAAVRAALDNQTSVAKPSTDSNMPMTVNSTLHGTFYRSVSPGEPPFVKEGDVVSAGQTVGMIEIMKTFTPVVAPKAGTIVRFLIENEAPVMPEDAIYEID